MGSTFFSEFFIRSACYVRAGEIKIYGSDGKHHPIFCVYGTFRKTSSPFHERRVCRMQTLTEALKNLFNFARVYVFLCLEK